MSLPLLSAGLLTARGVMIRHMHSFALLIFIGACSAGPSRIEARPGELWSDNRPQWFRDAVAESRQTLDLHCVDYAPVEILFTEDPLWIACMRESMSVVIDIQKRAYAKALSQCVDDMRQTGSGSCCPERVSSRPDIEGRLTEMCNRDCKERAGRPQAATRAVRPCEPAVAPVVRHAARGATPAVLGLVASCRFGHDAIAECARLPTEVERNYCTPYCSSGLQKFMSALEDCMMQVKAGFPPSCRGVDEDTQAECRKRCESAASGGASPAQPPIQHDAD